MNPKNIASAKIFTKSGFMRFFFHRCLIFLNTFLWKLVCVYSVEIKHFEKKLRLTLSSCELMSENAAF